SRGEPRALSLLGLTTTPSVRVDGPSIEQSSMRVGGVLRFRGSVYSSAKGTQNLVIGYRIGKVRNGRMNRTKPYRLDQRVLQRNQHWQFVVAHPMIAQVTRPLQAGRFG